MGIGDDFVLTINSKAPHLMTDQQIQQVTLDEVREVRTMLIDVVQRLSSLETIPARIAVVDDMAQRVATLESQTKTVLGNGQPGRLTLVEQSVKELQSWRWRMAGIATASSAVVSALVAVMVKFKG
jgi:hypothetical protein